METSKKQVEQKKIGVNINLDSTPILYTDNIQMSANNDGIIVNVFQPIMSRDQLRLVARLGMSRNHAKKVLKELGRLLAMTEGVIHTGEKVKN